MNEEIINDFKQFITATIAQQLGQQTAELRTELRADLRADIGRDIRQAIEASEVRLIKKIDDLSASVAEAFEASNEDTANRLDNHEQRLSKLEAKAV